jgi:septum site-determining protein MinC
MALILTPEPPLEAWLTVLDQQMARSAAFFANRPVIINLSALAGHEADLPALLAELEQRELRIIGVEGAGASMIGQEAFGHEAWGRTPLLTFAPNDRPAELQNAAPEANADPGTPPAPAPAKSLVLDLPVRSGQSVIWENGDVTVIGSVASGAEIIAGGSIHVYGTLRGRVVAGLQGGAGARIFCRKLEAELLSIDGLYLTAEEWGDGLRGRAVQAWRDGDTVRVAALD